MTPPKAALFTPRSLLYVPADNVRALNKAQLLAQDPAQRPDGVILDLEDAVVPEHKEQARANAYAALRQGFAVPVLVRINALNTPWEPLDRQLLLSQQPDGVVLPKAEDPAAYGPLQELGAALWLMIETPRGVLNAPALAAVEGVAGLLVGSNDLALALRARPGPQRAELLYALQAVVLAGRASGRAVLDAVYNDIRDLAGFEAQCQQGRRLGFDGKTLIHPGQIAAAHRAFGVSNSEVQAAQALVEAWQHARAEGKSVLNYGGQMVEELHVRQAQEVLAHHQSQNQASSGEANSG